jgi:2-oxoglutarate dehydrogenase E2 component (dihydrolipoamide succinyltransferase)
MIEITLPPMGEGIIDAEITRWMVREGMQVEADQSLVEVATDKVDSEIPAPVSGRIHKILIGEGDTVKVGQVMALIAEGTGDEHSVEEDGESRERPEHQGERETAGSEGPGIKSQGSVESVKPEGKVGTRTAPSPSSYEKVAFLSPVIRKLAVDNRLSPDEIQRISGSGIGGRITRADVMAYLAERASRNPATPAENPAASTEARAAESPLRPVSREQILGGGPSTAEEMDRMRRLIADHMVYSKQVAPHVTSFMETDVTGMILWRNRVRDEFLRKYGQKLTVTTLIVEAVAAALKEHPGINVSVDGYTIIRKHSINIGMATALPDGNLIVPVIHDVDLLNLGGLAARVNDLAERARTNSLLPSEIQGGTFTVTNLGPFDNLSGTPIINQPQVAILAVGAIIRKPALVETASGPGMGIRDILMLSLAYDHRVVDGALGGTFLKSISQRLGNFDTRRKI